MRLFHFSDDPSIEEFVPRPVRVASRRPAGQEWLNGPLVWAVDEVHQALYLFPRDCPRILLWPTRETTREDREKWWGDSSAKMIAYIETSWLDRHRTALLFRYEFPHTPFEDLHDAGMWVSRASVRPRNVVRVEGLCEHLKQEGVELRAQDSFAHLEGIWNTSLHASGIRLRNARNWPLSQ